MLTSTNGSRPSHPHIRSARSAFVLIVSTLSVPLACGGTSNDDGTGGGPSGSGGGSGGECRPATPGEIGCPTDYCDARAQTNCQADSDYDAFAVDHCVDGTRVTFSDGHSEIACFYESEDAKLVWARGHAATPTYCDGTSTDVVWGEEPSSSCDDDTTLGPCSDPTLGAGGGGGAGGEGGAGGDTPELPPATCYDGWGECRPCCVTTPQNADCTEPPFNIPGYTCTENNCVYNCHDGELMSGC